MSSGRAARAARLPEEEEAAAAKVRRHQARRAAKEAEAAAAAAVAGAEEQQALAEDAQASADADSDAEAGDAAASDADGADSVVDEQLADTAAAQMALLQEQLAAAERRAVAAEADAAYQRAERADAKLRTAEAVERAARREGGTLQTEQRARAQQAVDEARQRRREQEGSSDDEEAALMAEAQRQAAELAATEQRIRARRDEKEHAKKAAAGAQCAAVAMERAAAAAVGRHGPNAVAVAQRSLLPSPLASPPHARANGAAAAAALRALGGSAAVRVPEPPAPKELTAAEAAKPAVLEDWIYAVERLLDALGMAEFGEQLRMARRYWDRSVQAWWAGALLLANERGEAIDDWQTFVDTLRANYSPVADADVAEAKLFDLKMAAGEKMEAYVARAQELYNRVPRVRLDSQTAAGFLLRGVDRERFPMTYSGVSQAVQSERKATGGRGLQFEAVRARLVEAAVSEPGQWLTKSAGSSGGNTGAGNAYRKQRVAAVAAGRFATLDGEEDETDSSATGGSSVNAVNVADMKCFRCSERGHTARECKKPDKRTCYGCGKVGHLRKDCQDAEGARKGLPKN